MTVAGDLPTFGVAPRSQGFAIFDEDCALTACLDGDLSVHEVATSLQDSRLAYLSYCSGGVCVIGVDGSGISEVAAFIDEGGNDCPVSARVGARR